MECGSCGAVIPDDSIFCSECGARQEISRAGSFSAVGSTSLGGGEVTGGRGFGVVSGEAVRQQRDMQQQGMPQGIPADILQNIASGLQQQNNLPPGGQLPPQQPSQFPNQMSNQFLQQQPFIPQGQQPMQQNIPTNVIPQQSDIPQQPRGPTLASGAVPSNNVESQLGKQLGGTTVSNNPASSPTDAMVNRLAETERAVKNERRNQWLNMNQSSASNVLANLGAELPAHLRDAQGITPAAEVIAGTMGQSNSDGPNDALLRRMCEVASRRVARKRGVAVETPEAKISDGVLVVNLTYVDDGRVLDTPEDLSSAFEHAIQTEVALKGYDMNVEIVLSCMKDGEVKTIGAEEEEDDEEMFACEVCDGLVKESDPKCPHCGAIFEEEEEEEPEQTRKGPPGPSRSGPPGPKKSGGGPPGPSRSGPPGPKKSGGPPGPSRSGPPGPKKSGGGPPGPSRSGPPGPKKSGGPPGPSRSGPSGPSKGGPPGPKKGGPPGASKGGPPGPKKGGPPGGGPPKGGPSGPKKGGPPGPKKGGPPGPKRGPPK